MKKLRKSINHSFLMVKKNIRSYLLLSVTIVISFSFLLAFFMYSDSNVYNKYKEIFSVPESIIEVGDKPFYVYGIDNKDVNSIKYNILIKRLQNMEGTQFFQYYYATAGLNYYSDDKNTVTARIYFMPKDFLPIYIDGSGSGFSYIESMSGKSIIDNPSDIIVDKTFYDLLPPQGDDKIRTVTLPIQDKDGNTEFRKFNIVGVVSNQKNNEASSKEDNKINQYFADIYMSSEIAKEYNSDTLEENIYINSENNASEIYNLCKELNIFTLSSYEYQMQANEDIKNQIFLKGITVIILFSLLGINLYSSFNNALKERCFEIGVKRAIGAGKRDIIKQFFIEGMIVMTANIIISVLFVLNLSVIYKFIQKVAYNNQWVIYINLYSIIIFLFSVLFLSLSFSLLFAYQSTQVEIVKHLKLE